MIAHTINGQIVNIVNGMAALEACFSRPRSVMLLQL